MLETIGRYRLVAEIGRGEGTVVYRATDPLLNRVVALKTFAQPGSDPGAAEEWLVRFRHQIEVASKLDQPCFVRVLDAGVEDTLPYVVEELVEGETLAQVLRARSFSAPERLSLAAELAAALATAHAAGVVHGHLRPSNVLIDTQGNIRITDFGLADLGHQADDSTPTPDSQRIHYRAPEQIYRKRSDERTDVFTLGLILYEMLFHQRPFAGTGWYDVTQKILNQEPPLLRDSSGQATDMLHQVLARALAKDPLERYQSASDLHADLVTLAAGAGDAGATGSSWRGLRDEAVAPDGAGPYLVLRDGDEQRTLPLRGTVFRIGRGDKENDLSLGEERVSRRHAAIHTENGRCVIEDRASKHGTFVNGIRITERTILVDGDRIELGRSARVRLTFHAGREDSRSSQDHTPLPQQHLQRLLHLVLVISSSLSLDEILSVVMDEAIRSTGAERGFIMLRDAEGTLSTRLSRRSAHAPASEQADKPSHGIIERCLATGETVALNDIDDVTDVAQQASVADLSLKSVLAVPLIVKGSRIGVLYLDSRQHKAPFPATEIELLRAFAMHAAIAIENARLYELAIFDPLTGTFKRDHFDLRVKEEFQRATRHGSHLSLLFIDIDHFKRINDTHGHPVGDVALREVGRILRELGRSTDIVARYGGEEFVLIAPETRLDYARNLAERIRESIAAGPLRVRDLELRITASLGVACYQPGSAIDSAAELVRTADSALLAAKKQGRNQVVIAGAIDSGARSALTPREPPRP